MIDYSDRFNTNIYRSSMGNFMWQYLFFDEQSLDLLIAIYGEIEIDIGDRII